MITTDNIIAEVKNTFKGYSEAGLIDELTIENSVEDCLKRFGTNITVLHDTVIEIQNGKGTLPKNFYSLYSAFECSPVGYNVKKEDLAIVSQNRFFLESVERSTKWDSCNPTCVETGEKTITNTIYLNDRPVDFYYNKPRLLTLGKRIIKDCVASDCRNKLVRDNPHEITINNHTIHTNYKEGSIYLVYYGFEMDDDESLIIPDTPKNALRIYIEYYCKFKVLEDVLSNQEDKNMATIFKYYYEEKDRKFIEALSDVNFSKLTPNSFKKLKLMNFRNMQRFENITRVH